MRSKYNAKRTVVDGITFASKKEAKRYGELKLLEKAGEIRDLELQPWYALMAIGSGEQVGSYVADFKYFDKRFKRAVVEDVKGFRTPLYKWKKKHVEAQYGIQITEV
jgi:dsDNA-binding SOS-regulon protein